MILFLLILILLRAEIQAIRTRKSLAGVTGIKAKDVENLMSQPADDTPPPPPPPPPIHSDGNRESSETVIKILTEFALWSGLKIKSNKSQIVWLGSRTGLGTVFSPHFKLSWNQTRVDALVITY